MIPWRFSTTLWLSLLIGSVVAQGCAGQPGPEIVVGFSQQETFANAPESSPKDEKHEPINADIKIRIEEAIATTKQLCDLQKQDISKTYLPVAQPSTNEFSLLRYDGKNEELKNWLVSEICSWVETWDIPSKGLKLRTEREELG
jgi:hypothetical protein